jgi:hypothetical protein
MYPDWETPEIAHSDEIPFCGRPGCRCHYQPERVERYIVQPIERGELDIPAALDRYYGRVPMLALAGKGR